MGGGGGGIVVGGGIGGVNLQAVFTSWPTTTLLRGGGILCSLPLGTSKWSLSSVF